MNLEKIYIALSIPVFLCLFGPFALLGIHKFMLISLYLSTFFIINCLQSKNSRIEIYRPDVFWFIFLIFSLSSIIWAKNPSFVIEHACFWSLLFLWVIFFRQLNFEYYLVNFQVTIYILFLLYWASFILDNIDSSNFFFSKYVGFNSNYISLALTSLSAFLALASNKQLIKWISVIGLIIGFILSISGDTFFSFFLGVAIFAFLFFDQYLSSRKLIIGSSVLAIILVTILYSDLTPFNRKWFFSEFYSASKHVRFIMVKNSMALFIDNSLLGVGMGNWHLEVFKYGVEDIAGQESLEYSTKFSHNLFTQLLAEIGIFGFSFFIFPILIFFQKAKKFVHSSSFNRGIIAFFIIYLCASFFYRSINFHSPQFFSGIQFIAFGFLGLLLSKNTSVLKIKKLHLNLVLSCISVTCLLWTFNKYQDLKKTTYAESMINSDSERSIELFEDSYNNYTNTTFGDDLKPIHFQLAELYQGKSDYDRANLYYLKALESNPFNYHVLMRYALFLIRDYNKPSKAIPYASLLIDIQPKHFEGQLLMAEVHIRMNNFIDAQRYLDNSNQIENKSPRHAKRLSNLTNFLNRRINENNEK